MGADISRVRNDYPCQLLEDCIEVGNITIAKNLISIGVPFNDSILPQIIKCAIINNDLEIIKVSFDYNSSLRDGIVGKSLNELLVEVNFDPLDQSQYIPIQSTIESLVNNGIDVNSKDAHLNTALHNYILNPAIARSLIKYGADIHAKNSHNHSPLSILNSSVRQKYIAYMNNCAVVFNKNYNHFLHNKTFFDSIYNTNASLRWAVYTKYCKDIDIKAPTFEDANKFFRSKVVGNIPEFAIKDTIKMLDLPSEVLDIEMKYRGCGSDAYIKLNADLLRLMMRCVSFKDTLSQYMVCKIDDIMFYMKEFLSVDDCKAIMHQIIECNIEHGAEESKDDYSAVSILGDNLDMDNI